MRHSKTILLAAIAVLLAWYFFGGGIKAHLRFEITQMAKDAEKQYELARRAGNHIDAYAKAGLAAAAYLQMEDQANYSKWKRRQQLEASTAGIRSHNP